MHFWPALLGSLKAGKQKEISFFSPETDDAEKERLAFPH